VTTELPRVIGLHGYARSGKDTVFGFLAEYGYRRLAFADVLRLACYRLNPIIGARITGGEFRLQELVDQEGWDDAKSHPEVRRMLQVMGTEVGRELIRDSVWVDIVLDQIKAEPEERFAITDVRFPNELVALRENFPSGELWKVNRPGVGPVNAHVSDAGLADELFDVIVENDGTLEDLRLHTFEALKVRVS
jgi:hypothetical protein